MCRPFDQNNRNRKARQFSNNKFSLNHVLLVADVAMISNKSNRFLWIFARFDLNCDDEMCFGVARNDTNTNQEPSTLHNLICSLTMDSLALNSTFLDGSLFEDSRSRFEQWKRHLEFQYDFVKVLPAIPWDELMRFRASFRRTTDADRRRMNSRRNWPVFENSTRLVDEMSDTATTLGIVIMI